MIRDDINQLVEEITKTHPEDEIFQAKKDFLKISGEIFEDDKSYESRIGSFLEWYTFERPHPDSGLTPVQSYLQSHGESLTQETRELAQAISQNIHSLFTAKKIKSDYVVVLDILDDKKYEVKENQGPMLFNYEDIFEGRLIPYNGHYYFTDHFCYHPKPTVGFIKSRVKILRVKEEEALNLEKKLQKNLLGPQKSLGKVLAKLEKLRGKLEGITKENKIDSLKKEIDELENQKNQFETQISEIENQLTELRTEIIEGEHNRNRFTFIRKLSYMSLKWERSRQIDVRDIYQD
ncbi:MAG: hypothetical protein OEZ51_01245 [Nitrospinota bacterium]|nr:hypothetical protein [Nitrospinota bacterium]